MAKFKFSVIIPVYNVEEYLGETIESVINQTIGFEDNIQIVLVNDGSPDNSEEVCLEYKEKYPNNIIYYKQENAGVSAARNQGLKLAEGEIINFLDSDDTWNDDTFKIVWNQYQKHQDVYVFTTKMRYFDGKNVAHILNYKYKEEKVIDIREDYAYPQLSTCSCFIKREVAQKYKYDSSIKNEEDTRFISEILLDYPKMMVLKKPVYHYRARSDKSSASQTSAKNKLWYTVTPKKVYQYLFTESKKKYGKVLDYFKYLIAYDLGWRLNVPIDDNVLTKEEQKEYIKDITNLIKEVDLKFFIEQKNNYPSSNIFIMNIKEGKKPKDLIVQEDHDMFVKIGEDYNAELAFIRVDDIYIKDSKVRFAARVNKCIYDYKKIKLKLDDKEVSPEFYELRNNQDELAYNGDNLSQYIGIKCEIDMAKTKEFGFIYDKGKETLNVTFSNQCIITNKLKGSYFNYKDKTLLYDDGDFKIVKRKFTTSLAREFKNQIGLIQKKKIKIALLRLIIILTKLIPIKNVWLLSDRINKADDNAEHLLKYINDNKIEDINAYYVISKECPDYNRMKKYGKVVSNTSLKYKILFHKAKYIVSSHAEYYITNLYGGNNQYYRDLFDFKYVFLQHGITKDDISPWLNPNTKHIDMFVSAVELEYNSLQINGYDKDVVQLTGFPRYDGLVRKSKEFKQENSIIVSFTWRNALANKIDKKTGNRLYNPEFKNSNYSKWLNSLLNNEELNKALKKYGYKLKFIPHPNLISQIEDIKINDDNIELLYDNIDYQKEFCTNKLMVTDCSSVFFDFAYLKKPVVYYQPDNEELYASQIYNKGYFDYPKIGFGEVCYQEEEAVEAIVNAIRNDCKLDKKYEKRINNFFKYNDEKNCERVVKSIKNIK